MRMMQLMTGNKVGQLSAILPRSRQVSENQCHMCMPIGAVTAFKGIENAMVLVHGSQGCSTYMRLANIEHYNRTGRYCLVFAEREAGHLWW